MKRGVLFSIVITICITLGTSFFVVSAATTSKTSCLDITFDLYKGLSDDDINGIEVTNLQKYLISKKYLTGTQPTGYFGTLTERAVKYYQAKRNIEATGYVGPLTRALLKKETCKTVVAKPTVLKLSSLSKKSGPLASKITITGTGFDATNNTVLFGITPVTGVASANGKTLTFTIPVLPSQSCTNFSSSGCFISDVERKKMFGTYPITLLNSKGVSNSLNFTLTAPKTTTTRSSSSSNSTKVKPAITLAGLSKVGRNDQNLWIIDVKYNTSTTLNASVIWGDAGTTTVQNSKSFTINGERAVVFDHIYNNPGKYRAIFKVSDPNNIQASTTKVVEITVATTSPSVSESFAMSKLLPISGRIGDQIVITGSGFAASGNTVFFGRGGYRNMNSYNYGTLILLPVPTVLNPCDVITVSCQSSPHDTVPGKYSVGVGSPNGRVTSKATFTVIK